ncbi:hypothetical protein [Gordonia sihwensis]|uniref:hypothetical protein n=1 Tax=Gordonia sihwensis TaxID=173559 RepID=UPI003D955B2E
MENTRQRAQRLFEDWNAQNEHLPEDRYVTVDEIEASLTELVGLRDDDVMDIVMQRARADLEADSDTQ